MNVTELKSEGLKKEYKVMVPAQDFEKEVDAKINEIAKTVKLPGFRAGKAPVSMLKQKYAASVKGEVLEDLVRKSTDELIKDKNLRPAMMPDIKITAFKDGENLEFEVSLENLPEIKAGKFEDIALDKYMADVAAEIAERNGLTHDDIAWIVPHQANLRIIDATAKRLGVDMEKVMINIQKYGNTSAGTIPICLWEWEDKLKKGDNLILAAFGAGFTWGAIYLKWGYNGKQA